MLTDIIKVKGNWLDVLDDCRSTVGKPPLRKEPSKQFKKDILMAEHSPIRDISIRWKWKDIPSWVATHWSRHKWECFIKTQRTDRTGIDRSCLPQDAPVDFVGDANAQHLIDTMRKRLCYQAAKETREYAEDFKEELRKVEPELSDVLVPNCVYRGGCPEMKTCGFYEKLMRESSSFSGSNLQLRYLLFNKIFYENRDNKKG